MNCIVTAGPTCEPLDEVRRLTNFSTGRLGSELSTYLNRTGHRVTLLLGRQATYNGPREAAEILSFETTADLRTWFERLAAQPVDAIFHAAAVSDFTFGTIWRRSAAGDLTPARAGKIPSGPGSLLAELVPTVKIISHLRDWYPRAQLIGWKYEVDGDRAGAVAKARNQIGENRTNAAVVNGRAYGPGYGLVAAQEECVHLETREALYAALEHLLA